LTEVLHMMTPDDYRLQTLELLRGYRASQVLIACAELGVFAALDDEAVAADDLAGRLDLDTQALSRLLNAAVALGLLERWDAGYANSAQALACLATDGPFSLGNLARREGAFFRRWSRLSEAVRTGRRPEENVRDEGRTNWVRDFELALYDIARLNGTAIAEALGPQLLQHAGRPIRVLDLGGGHGGYSIALARRYDDLQAVVFDLPPVAAVAREIVATTDVADRVAVRAGDFKTDDLGAGFDLALLFGVLVSEPPADAVALLRKTAAALVPGGTVVIRGFYLQEDRTGPPEATLFDLQMLLSTGAGEAHRVADLTGWLTEAGFALPDLVALPAPEESRLLVARKPGG